MINRFILNEVSYFGAGSRKELPEALARLNLHKALVTTDKGLLKVGTAQMVTEVLDKAGFPYEIYSEIKPNPYSNQRETRCRSFQGFGCRLYYRHRRRLINGYSKRYRYRNSQPRIR